MAPSGTPLQEIPFTSLEAREHANRIPQHLALTASDCITDEDTVKGRAGSRLATAAALASSGTVQHSGRFRPSNTSARNVVVIAGEVFIVKDPTSETASDGAVFSLGVPTGWTGSAAICGVQLGTSYYLGIDQANVAAVRINWDGVGDLDANYTLESLAQYPTPAAPTVVQNNTFAWTLFTDASLTLTASGCVQQTNANTGMGNLPASWRAFTLTNNGNNDPLTGAYAQYKFSSTTPNADANGDIDVTAYDWLVVAVTPNNNGGSSTVGELAIELAANSGGSPGTWVRVGITHDTPFVGGSPVFVFCDLRNLGGVTKVRYIRLLLDENSTPGGKFACYGFLFLPAKPILNPETYYVDIYNCSTGAESTLSGGTTLAFGQPTVNTFPDCYMDGNEPNNSNKQDSIFNASDLAQRSFNQTVQPAIPVPALDQIGSQVTVSGTTPTGYTGSLTVRVWKLMDDGTIRLTNATGGLTGGSATCPDASSKAANTAYSLSDPGGIGAKVNQVYRAGGTLPRCNALAARAQRLVAGWQNRLFISSYVPTSDTKTPSNHPFPQFPDIALEDADGWSFDLAPSPKEQILVLNGEGDALYISTTESTFAMSDLSPNSLPFLVKRRGAVSRFAGGFFEEMYAWCAWDGVYQATGKSEGVELSFPVRRYYKDTFLPGSNTRIGYNQDQRALFAYTDSRYVRFRYELNRWSTGTLGFNVRGVLSWNETGITGNPPQFWLVTDTWKIGRVQSAVSRDLQSGTNTGTGTAIPDWVYSTGYSVSQSPGVLKGLVIDADGSITVTQSKTGAATQPGEARQYTVATVSGQDEVWRQLASDLRAYKFRLQFSGANAVTLRRAMVGGNPVDAVGGGN